MKKQRLCLCAKPIYFDTGYFVRIWYNKKEEDVLEIRPHADRLKR